MKVVEHLTKPFSRAADRINRVISGAGHELFNANKAYKKQTAERIKRAKSMPGATVHIILGSEENKSGSDSSRR